MPNTRYNKEGGRPGSPTTNSLGDGGLGLRPNVRELSARREDGGANQSRVVPQVGSYAGLPMSSPGNAGRANVPDIFEPKKSRLPQRQVTRPQLQDPSRDVKPPPGLEGLPPTMYGKAWSTYLDPKIKGLGVYDPMTDVNIKRDQADIASLKTPEDEAPFAPRVRPQLSLTPSVVSDGGSGLLGFDPTKGYAEPTEEEIAQAKAQEKLFNDWYNSLSPEEKARYDAQSQGFAQSGFDGGVDYNTMGGGYGGGSGAGQGTSSDPYAGMSDDEKRARGIPVGVTGTNVTGLGADAGTRTGKQIDYSTGQGGYGKGAKYTDGTYVNPEDDPNYQYDPRATGNAMFGVRSQQDMLELQNEIYAMLRDPSNIVNAPGVPEGYAANLQTGLEDFFTNFNKQNLRGNESEQELSRLLTSTVTDRLGGQGLGLSEEALRNQYATQFSDLERMQRQQEERIIQQGNVGRRLSSMGTVGDITRNTLGFDEQRRDIISNVIAENQRRQQDEMNARIAQAQGLSGTQYDQQLQAEQLQADLDKYRFQSGLQKSQFLSSEDQRRLDAERDKFGMGMDVADFDYRQKQQNVHNLMNNLRDERSWYGQDRAFDLALAQAEAGQGDALDGIFAQLMSQEGMSGAMRQLYDSYLAQRKDNQTIGDWVAELIGNWDTGNQGGQV